MAEMDILKMHKMAKMLSEVTHPDETGCIWTWESKTWGLKWFWILLGWRYVPDYFRVAAYTLWDDIGVGNP